MASANLAFATTRGMISVLGPALAADPLFQPDKTGASRSAETMVFDSFGYHMRDFPCLVVVGKPGNFMRMGIGDKVVNYFGVGLAEEGGGTDQSRTFDVSLVTVVGSNLTLDYKGDTTGMDPLPPFILPIQQKTVGLTTVNYVTLTGNHIGASSFPLNNFIAYSPQYPTGMVFGGMYTMSMEVTACGRNTQSRDMLSDRAGLLIWLEKKLALRKLGIIILDVSFGGFADIPYGADKIYQSRLNVSLQVEFAAIAQYVETVTAISVVGTAVDAQA